MKEYLKLFKKEISYDHYHQWSGLDFKIASGNWMKNIRELIDHKKDKRGLAGKNYTNPFKQK